MLILANPTWLNRKRFGVKLPRRFSLRCAGKPSVFRLDTASSGLLFGEHEKAAYRRLQPKQKEDNMSNTIETKTTEEAQANYLIVYAVREYFQNKERKSVFLRVGTAFPHKDGTGFNIEMDALPVDGKLVILPQKVKVEVASE